MKSGDSYSKRFTEITCVRDTLPKRRRFPEEQVIYFNVDGEGYERPSDEVASSMRSDLLVQRVTRGPVSEFEIGDKVVILEEGDYERRYAMVTDAWDTPASRRRYQGELVIAVRIGRLGLQFPSDMLTVVEGASLSQDESEGSQGSQGESSGDVEPDPDEVIPEKWEKGA